MRCLITGGAGFVGSHLSDAFLKCGEEVTALDVASDLKVRHHLDNRRFRYVNGSVLDRDTVESLVSWSDVVYHMAAVVGVDNYVTDPLKVLNININGTQNVLGAALKNRKKVVFSSTSEVYGKSLDIPFKEDGERVLGSTTIDRWSYSTSKAVGEHFCFAFAKQGLPVVVTRFFNLYGPRLDKANTGRVISIFLGQLLSGAPLTVIGDGRQTRCFTYIEDAIRAIVAAGVKKEAVGEVINIGSDEEVSIIHLAERMIRLSGQASSIVFVPEAEAYGVGYEDIRRRVPDITKMREILGVAPRIGLNEGLKRTIEWFSREAANSE
ncbi:MAG TPA: NAD-dependent epimerase/dehydratase family protein [Verrucomicrobiae bacterium]|jgi:UDP-glucose 4-epimerase|nr:NAD-dependent epimerase/dehydratase family protein [Verrucomicrobiae bacterium]